MVGHIARFDPVKRHVDLIETARRLHRAALPVAFVLVGQGELLEAARSAAAGLPNVHFLGSSDEIPGLLRRLDAFVLCSDHEATPLALLEAMACGLPCVATAVGGVPAVLASGAAAAAGILVPPRDPEALAAALARLAADPDMRARLSRAARARALEFSFERTWRSYSALYDPGGPTGSA
jgi:glycosyltransferase involved in cell wall biosynthesis